MSGLPMSGNAHRDRIENSSRYAAAVRRLRRLLTPIVARTREPPMPMTLAFTPRRAAPLYCTSSQSARNERKYARLSTREDEKKAVGKYPVQDHLWQGEWISHFVGDEYRRGQNSQGNGAIDGPTPPFVSTVHRRRHPGGNGARPIAARDTGTAGSAPSGSRSRSAYRRTPRKRAARGARSAVWKAAGCRSECGTDRASRNR
jgi:hypothetical protein